MVFIILHDKTRVFIRVYAANERYMLISRYHTNLTTMNINYLRFIP